MMLATFLFFFALFTATGMASWFRHRNTTEDYFLAGREVPAWLVALSYGATISSGVTFIGFAGLAYQSGISALVAVSFCALGDYCGWRIAGDKVRRLAREKNAQTYPALVGEMGAGKMPAVTLATALLSVVFLGGYCGAQLVAGAKIGQALFGWDFGVFVFLGTVVLLAYCWAGGIRASIWTDAVQAAIIVLSLFALVAAGLARIGGLGEMWARLGAIDPALTGVFQPSLLLVAAGWFIFTVGVLGQPQLMVRHMAARSEEDLRRARGVYFAWRWTVLLLSVCSGMIARVLIPAGGAGFDPELSIPLLWQDLLPPALVGLLVAGLFSATMSTADSLLLSCSSALTQHLVPKWRDSYAWAKAGTVLACMLAVLIALYGGKGVLEIVILAWGGLAAPVAPVVIVQLLGGRLSQRCALAMMAAGFGTMMAWRYALGLEKAFLDTAPGILAGLAVYGLARLVTSQGCKACSARPRLPPSHRP